MNMIQLTNALNAALRPAISYTQHPTKNSTCYFVKINFKP